MDYSSFFSQEGGVFAISEIFWEGKRIVMIALQTDNRHNNSRLTNPLQTFCYKIEKIDGTRKTYLFLIEVFDVFLCVLGWSWAVPFKVQLSWHSPGSLTRRRVWDTAGYKRVAPAFEGMCV